MILVPEKALPPHLRPFIDHTYHTHELPATPQRDYRISASAWIEAPAELLSLCEDLGEPTEYKRRISRFLLWRAGPPVGEAWYLAIDAEDLSVSYRFRLSGKHGVGQSADGQLHERFRTWKEALRDA